MFILSSIVINTTNISIYFLSHIRSVLVTKGSIKMLFSIIIDVGLRDTYILSICVDIGLRDYYILSIYEDIGLRDSKFAIQICGELGIFYSQHWGILQVNSDYTLRSIKNVLFYLINNFLDSIFHLYFIIKIKLINTIFEKV